MCSTPRPKSKVKSKGGTSSSLLSNMSPEARSRFAERANIAQERRHQLAIKSQEKKRQVDTSTKVAQKVERLSANKSQDNLNYWLLNASLKKAFTMLFFSKPKQA
jgi:hypothetical protein